MSQLSQLSDLYVLLNIEGFSQILLTLFIFFQCIFLWSVFKKDFSKVDMAWALSPIVLTFCTIYFSDRSLMDRSLKEWLIFSLPILWGFRLFVYLYIRNKKTGEDFRYGEMRKNWGQNANFHAYGKIFLFQWCLSLIIFFPVILFLSMPSKSMNFLDFVGIFFFLFFLVFETVADYQKFQFKKQNRESGSICRTGLWANSRHANYFAEASLWWSFFLFFFDSPLIIVAWLSPFLLNVFLLKFSGVPFLEKGKEHDGQYQKYKSEVPRLIPIRSKWFWTGLGLILLAGMFYTTLQASFSQNILELFRDPTNEVGPWFKATLVDFYLNQFWLWIVLCFFESRRRFQFLWALIMFFLGSMATSLAVIIYYKKILSVLIPNRNG